MNFYPADGRPGFRSGRSFSAVSSSFLIACLLLLLPGTVFSSSRAVETITINVPAGLLKSPIIRLTVDDVLSFLGQGFAGSRISINDPTARVQINLPRIGAHEQVAAFSKRKSYPCLSYPDHWYEWRSSQRGGRVYLHLNTPTAQGVSFGLYGLLQEKLGFRFYHPRRTIIPSHARWPLPVSFSWEAAPRFDKKGFHAHTLHPIELTEQFTNQDYPGAEKDIREYIDWLVRNQQNLLQFYLLRDVDRKRWMGHAKAITNYAHERGIHVGVMISLSSLQQKAFQTIRLFRPFPSYRAQIDHALAWLFLARWDFVTLDFTMGEYLPDLERLLPGTSRYLRDQISGMYGAKVMVATHVIPAQKKGNSVSARADAYERSTGMLIHSVMCYSVTEDCAPVYGNDNQHHMLERAIRETKKRETWYWPESSYWVSFDSSVPLFLLPYLQARWEDMHTLQGIGVEGHLTFTSGWEWGYWLVDWSIARWSWEHRMNGRPVRTGPLSAISDLFGDRDVNHLWSSAAALQNVYLKDRGVLPFMSSVDPSAELPWPFNKPFLPRPPHSYLRLVRGAHDAATVRAVQASVHELEAYSREMSAIVEGLKAAHKDLFLRQSGYSRERQVIANELTRALEITTFRARHRALVIRALISKRTKPDAPVESERLLQEASKIRASAQVLVTEQEETYRYPVALIARQREDFTAYHFGYLYPAGNLYFWLREEEQVRKDRFDAFFMNIWNFRRLLSLETLF